jgi:hypothetical protein
MTNTFNQDVGITDRPTGPAAEDNADSLANVAAQVAAVEWTDDHREIRVYCNQELQQIQEYCWQGGDQWTTGATLGGATLNSRVAVAHWTSDRDTHLRVYYQNTANAIIEKCYDTPNWTAGHTFNGAASGTGIAAVAWYGSDGSNLRIYYQNTANAIIEQSYDQEYGWRTGQTFYSAAPGTGIAALYWTDDTGSQHRRLYYQDGNNNIIEQCYDNGRWTMGSAFSGAYPGTGIAAVQWWESGFNTFSSHVRLYYQNAPNSVAEQCYDTPNWTHGHTFTNVTRGTGIAAVYQYYDGGNHLRVYYEDTVHVIIEQCYDNGQWTTGQFAAPAN